MLLQYMLFSAKLLMDRIFLLVFMSALITADAVTQNMVSSNSTTSNYTCPCNSTTVSSGIIPEPRIKPAILPSVLGRLKVEWEKKNPCQGSIQFSINFTESILLCSEKIITQTLGKELCEERRCGEFLEFKHNVTEGYMIHENLTTTSETQCNTTVLTCKEKSSKKLTEDRSKELTVYKVITGLLLTLIAVVLLCRFAQPAYIAVHNRFSQKQQNRWIGPTQSQSVSYHRGQGSQPNNNTMKRQSYPGLERLTVYPSREPSSNRNSDYDSYGF
ncbi:T-cell surface glycoprotein CD5 [Tachysurus fulvidraco]|uniref:T-cell surface glycoprotein CD5 n=1 Tax=Tachysurus fulvidraco TaxID=1234273 RepID=UPI001FEE8E11|nr:T-cell surface glycoprotein CD5 [Tachysurus fulvidraco]